MIGFNKEKKERREKDCSYWKGHECREEKVIIKKCKDMSVERKR